MEPATLFSHSFEYSISDLCLAYMLSKVTTFGYTVWNFSSEKGEHQRNLRRGYLELCGVGQWCIDVFPGTVWGIDLNSGVFQFFLGSLLLALSKFLHQPFGVDEMGRIECADMVVSHSYRAVLGHQGTWG